MIGCFSIQPSAVCLHAALLQNNLEQRAHSLPVVALLQGLLNIEKDNKTTRQRQTRMNKVSSVSQSRAIYPPPTAHLPIMHCLVESTSCIWLT